MSDSQLAQTAFRPWHKQRIDPVRFLEPHCKDGKAPPWIVFEPDLTAEARPTLLLLRQQMSHDGTALHTLNLLLKLMGHFVKLEVFDELDLPDQHLGEWPVYHLGWIRLATVFPQTGVRLAFDNERNYPGERERASVLFRVEWVRAPAWTEESTT